MQILTRISWLAYLRSLVLTTVLWFGIPPFVQDSDSRIVSDESKNTIHQEDRWVSPEAPDYYILDLYFDSLLEHSIDDYDEHSVKLPVEEIRMKDDEEVGKPKTMGM